MSHDPPEPHDEPPAAPRKATFGETLSAVLWSFFGVRKRRDLVRDAATINPLHIIIAGIGLAALLVIGLLVLVHFITRPG
jgi:hypothetical protein